MKVRIKTIEEMIKEFGEPLDERRIRFGYTPLMERYMPKNRIIEVLYTTEPGKYVWLCDEEHYEFSISPDMIKEYIEISGSDIDMRQITANAEIYIFVSSDTSEKPILFMGKENLIKRIEDWTNANRFFYNEDRVIRIRGDEIETWFLKDIKKTIVTIEFPEE